MVQNTFWRFSLRCHLISSSSTSSSNRCYSSIGSFLQMRKTELGWGLMGKIIGSEVAQSGFLSQFHLSSGVWPRAIHLILSTCTSLWIRNNNRIHLNGWRWHKPVYKVCLEKYPEFRKCSLSIMFSSSPPHFSCYSQDYYYFPQYYTVSVILSRI